ncbi:hypothetical protein Nepgr_024127 [Nepenthes gracilis]|uniref:RRM domain-containing protein n=1 Tax=Nepenthes gracilis TaxID=150966 RepID=A0AAD3T409_NEPGR|nr:hypothetical protein Nepgr_024127 [Nepenthes gracilis]
MADGLWGRQALLHSSSAGLPKRPRTDFEGPPGVPPGQEMLGYLPQEDERGGLRVSKDTKTIGSAYDWYLQHAQVSSYGSGGASNHAGAALGRTIPGGVPGLPMMEPPVMGHPGPIAADLAPNGPGVGFRGRLSVDTMARPGRETVPLPPDASNTLYVECLPHNCTTREVAHIFRPFVGYKEVRLVSKDSKHRGGDPLILCFVDFDNPACAATALSALQGYKMDEQDPDSPYLRIQFSRYPGPRPGPGPRSRRNMKFRGR